MNEIVARFVAQLGKLDKHSEELRRYTVKHNDDDKSELRYRHTDYVGDNIDMVVTLWHPDKDPSRLAVDVWEWPHDRRNRPNWVHSRLYRDPDPEKVVEAINAFMKSQGYRFYELLSASLITESSLIKNNPNHHKEHAMPNQHTKFIREFFQSELTITDRAVVRVVSYYADISLNDQRHDPVQGLSVRIRSVGDTETLVSFRRSAEAGAINVVSDSLLSGEYTSSDENLNKVFTAIEAFLTTGQVTPDLLPN